MTRDWRWDEAVELPAPLRALNRMPPGLARRVASLDPADLCAAARRKAGLDDLGGPEVGAGLRALTESLEHDAELTPFGRMAIRANLVDPMAAGASVLDWHRREPSIAEERIEAPVVIIGLPRTGTTLLSFLLQQDASLRTLRHWEAMDPTPPPTLVEEATDRRLRAAEKQLDGLWRMAPGFRAIHPMEPAGPAECVTLLTQSMASMQFETQAHLPGYAAWMDRADLGPAYAHHRKVLQLLQWRSPGERWNLKTPAHLLALDTLLATYPDAKLIWTHRDPAEVVASVASLNCALHSIMSDDVDPSLRGPQWLDRIGTLVDRGVASLDRHPGAEVAHVAYADGRHRLGDQVGGIYAELGLELAEVSRRRMQAWMDANPQSRWGRHRYDPAEFALDDSAIAARFADYTARFPTG
ncbi:MAG: sulfotransferase [Actinomycetota bacterium]